jgi:hypothetical protein
MNLSKCPHCHAKLGNFMYADACPYCHTELEHNRKRVFVPPKADPNDQSALVRMFRRFVRFVES